MADEEIVTGNHIDPAMLLKAFSHPLRVGILQLLVQDKYTNEELAKRLGVASGKLYFHTKKLLDAGVIELAETRPKGPLTEKLYRATANRFILPEPIKGGDTPPLEPLIVAGLELYRTTWYGTEGLADQTEFGFHLVLPHTLERRRELLARVRALMEDFQQTTPDAPDIEPLAITLLLHAVPATAPHPERDSS